MRSAAAAAEVEEQVARRYQIKRRLGKGAYGIVWKAADRKTGAVVAVKKIFDAFRNRTDAQGSCSSCLILWAAPSCTSSSTKIPARCSDQNCTLRA